MQTKILIIGSGPAGYTAAIYAARAMLEPVIVTGIEQGGQLMITTDVENYPGFADPIQGPWLMEQMQAQAANCGAQIVHDYIQSLDLSGPPFTATGDGGTRYSADSIILATGAKAKWLGLKSESAYQGYGVSACATCDGFFFRNKPVLVVGGGNTAVEEALYLANIASSVTLIHRRDSLRAERILQERLFRHPKITVIWNSKIDEILGGGTPAQVTGARLHNIATNNMQDVVVDGVFVAIGHAPETGLFKDILTMKPNGYLWTAPESTATSMPGVFAAGDVTDDIYRQAVTAAGMGCMAALEAEKYVAELETRQAAE